MSGERHAYDTLGVVPIINAMGTATRVSGSLMPDVVRDAMQRASRAYVHLDELQAAVGRRIAELTRNDAAYVCSSATAGLVLATAACITGDDPEAMASLPRPDRVPGLPTRVVIHRCQRFAYDFSIRSVGVEFVEVGPSRAEVNLGETTQAEELRAAIDDNSGLIEMAEAEKDESLVGEAGKALAALQKRAAEMQLSCLLSGEADANDSYLEVHAGAGGTESQDWAEMLLQIGRAHV